jgi:PAS domain S-box-containing protein
MRRDFRDIEQLLVAYSKGDFKRRVNTSEEHNEQDAIIAGLHMLGQELSAVTISRDFFNSMFNAVSDIVIVLNKEGLIEEINDATLEQLSYSREDLLDSPVDLLIGRNGHSLATEIKRKRFRDCTIRLENRIFLAADKKEIPVEITVKYVPGKRGLHRPLAILTAKDIKDRLLNENRVLRAVIDAQEKDRRRFSRDLHDSLSQKLAAVKFLIGAVIKECGETEQLKRLVTADKAMLDAQSEVRSVCFNLMPRTLEEYGLKKAIREIGLQIEQSGKIRVRIHQQEGFPDLPADLEIDLYRVVQEFIQNSLKYAHCGEISIALSWDGDRVECRLRDNGPGIAPVVMDRIASGEYEGMGLRNMASRVQSHSGTLTLDSKPGAGVSMVIKIPYHGQ